MKTKFFLLALLIQIIFVSAQMDEKFYFPKKDLKPIEWSNFKEIKFPVENDTINTLILKPNEKPKATIFYFHGAGGNVTYYMPIVTHFLKNNFQVVMVDFRGYGKSTGNPTHKNIGEDGTKIFNEFLKMKEIEKLPKIIYGASIGTQIATLLAEENQNKINGLVLEGAMSSFGDIAAYYTPQFKAFLEKSYVSPYSAKENIKKINKIPVLIIHSPEDKDVPYDHGKVIFENANQPKEFLEFHGEHLYGMKYEGKKIIEKIDDMLKKNNK